MDTLLLAQAIKQFAYGIRLAAPAATSTRDIRGQFGPLKCLVMGVSLGAYQERSPLGVLI